jgi:N utilization substance protein A
MFQKFHNKLVYLRMWRNAMDINMGVLRELVAERGIDFESAAQAVEQALLAAYHKNEDSYEHARVELDRKTGHATVWARKLVSEDPAVDDELELGDEFDDTPQHFSRIASAAARQTILHKIRQAEDFRVLGDFRNKRDQIISGVVKPFEATEIKPGQDPKINRAQANGLIKLDVGSGIEVQLPLHEQVVTDDYTPGNRFKVYVTDVSRGIKGPQITVSRSHPSLVLRLFELEVPEINAEQVKIESIAREAGYRTKIAIKSLEEGVNAKGAFIGTMGSRARAVMNELGGEKIDIVDWDEDPAHYIANALSPAKVVGVKIADENAKSAHVLVSSQQLSLAIGREGQNARLAARLTGWKIDIASDAHDQK